MSEPRPAWEGHVAAALRIFGTQDIETLREVIFDPTLGVQLIVDEEALKEEGDHAALFEELEEARAKVGGLSVRLHLDSPVARAEWLAFCDDARLYETDTNDTPWLVRTLLHTVYVACDDEVGGLVPEHIATICLWAEAGERAEADLLAITHLALTRWPQARWSVEAEDGGARIAAELKRPFALRELRDGEQRMLLLE